MDHKLIESLEKTNAAMKDAIVEIITLRARIAELEAERGKVADGYVLVPVEPTEAMLEAAKIEEGDHGTYEEWKDFGYEEDVIATYKSMLSAAPSPTVKE